MKQRNFLHERQGKGMRVLWMCFILIVGIGMQGWGQASYTAIADANWHLSTTWTRGTTLDSDDDGIPDANDIVIIPTKIAVTLSQNESCASLSLNGSGNAASLAINSYTLTVSGDITGNNKNAIITITSGTLNVGGAISGLTTFTTGTGTVNFNGVTASQTIPNNTYIFNNITINNTHTGGAKFGGFVSATNILNSISVGNLNTGSMLSTGSFAVTRGTSDAITVAEGSTFNARTSEISWEGASGAITINGTFKTENSSGFSGAISPTNAPTITLGNNSTIEYTALGFQPVSVRNYRNLSISGTGLKTISGAVTVEGVITVNGALTVANMGTLTNNGSMVINSTSTTSGSFINNGTFSGTGTVTYNRWMDNTNLDPTVTIPNETTPGFSRWYITSAPVKVTSGFGGNGSKIHIDKFPDPDLYDFANYITSTNKWDYVSSLPGNLTPGHGYLISLNPGTNNSNISFTGGINGDLIDVPVVNDGWNALGNPYTSAIGAAELTGTSVKNFLAENSGILELNYSAIYVWNEPTTAETPLYNESQQYYRIIGNSGYDPIAYGMSELPDKAIQTGQGFLINVKANDTPQTAKFSKGTLGMQFHETNLTLKSAQVSWPGITLLAESKGQTRSTVVAYNGQMTTGLDVTYDAGLLSSSTFNVYTHLVGGDNTVDFAIQCLPDNQYRELSVPVGVDLPEGGELSFKASGVILPQGLYPVIEDKLLGTQTALKTETDSYTVVLDKSTKGTGRFYLSVAGIGVGTTEIPAEKKFKASYINNRLVVWGAVEPGTKAILYDITGRKVGEYPLEHLNRNEIMVSGLSRQMYLLKIEGKNYSQVIKVVGE